MDTVIFIFMAVFFGLFVLNLLYVAVLLIVFLVAALLGKISFKDFSFVNWKRDWWFWYSASRNRD
jgi:hypothetical protein